MWEKVGGYSGRVGRYRKRDAKKRGRANTNGPAFRVFQKITALISIFVVADRSNLTKKPPDSLLRDGIIHRAAADNHNCWQNCALRPDRLHSALQH